MASNQDVRIKIAPGRIVGGNRAGFPGARPVLDVLFTLDGRVRRVENFEVNQFVDDILRGVIGDARIPVLVDSPDEIVRYADVQCTARTTGEDVAGTSPAMTSCYAVPVTTDDRVAAPQPRQSADWMTIVRKLTAARTLRNMTRRERR